MKLSTTLRTFFRYFPVSERDKRWGLWLTTAGESHIPPESDYPPKGHPGGYSFDWSHGRTIRELQIVYISAGKGVLETPKGRLHPIESGDAFLLFPGVWHSYRPDRAVGWNEHWVGCDGPILRSIVKNGFVEPRRPVVTTRHEEMLLSAFSSVIESVRVNRPALQQVMASATLYILSLLYSAQQAREERGATITSAIQQAMNRMAKESGRDEVNLESIANDLNVSYTWFRRMFALHTGLSPHQYRMQLRIGRARTLLTETNMTVKEVAYNSGFGSDHYFCRLFKAKTGMSPEQWRRHH